MSTHTEKPNAIELLKNRARELFTSEPDIVDQVSVTLTTDPAYGWQDNQRLGRYNPITRNIKIYDVFQGGQDPETVIDTILPTYMHELIHAIQHRNMGTLVYLLTLVLCRPLFEAGARELEDALYGNILNSK